MLGNFTCFFLSIVDYYFFNGLFIKSLRNITRESNSLEQDQAQNLVGPDLGPNCLQRHLPDG